jgi:hypothetical protein
MFEEYILTEVVRIQSQTTSPVVSVGPARGWEGFRRTRKWHEKLASNYSYKVFNIASFSIVCGFVRALDGKWQV